MAMFLVLHLMEFIFLHVFNFLEQLAMLQTSTLTTQTLLKKGYQFHKTLQYFCS